MTLIDFTLSNVRRFYWSMGNPLAVKGLKAPHIWGIQTPEANDKQLKSASFVSDSLESSFAAKIALLINAINVQEDIVFGII